LAALYLDRRAASAELTIAASIAKETLDTSAIRSACFPRRSQAGFVETASMSFAKLDSY
jgi:hypothetical protein